MSFSAGRFLCWSLLGHLLMLSWMGFDFSNESRPSWSLFIHREKETSYLQLTRQSHEKENSERFRVTHDQNWPTLELTPQPISLNYKPYQTSADTGEEQGIIWQLSPNSIALHPKISLRKNNELKRHLLIDRSGTMTRVSESTNPLAQIYSSLSEQRKKDDQPWLVHSFSSQLTSHDSWEPNGPAPVQVFQKSEGQTRLLDALEELSQNIAHPAEIVIISDGDLDTQHKLSIERTLVQLKKNGISLYLLSPTLKSVPSWAAYYQKHLVSGQWPSSSPQDVAITSKSDLVSDGETDVIWEDAVPTMAHSDLTPIYFSPKGSALLYLDTSRRAHPTYIAMGRPQQPERLVQALLKRHQQRPTIQLTQHKMIIDVGSPSLKPLMIVTPEENAHSPHRPGLYALDLGNAHRIRFYHPSTGAFVLSQLQLWRNFVDSSDLEEREALHWPTWNSSTLSTNLGSSKTYGWKIFLCAQLSLFLIFLFPSFRLLPWRLFKARKPS